MATLIISSSPPARAHLPAFEFPQTTTDTGSPQGPVHTPILLQSASSHTPSQSLPLPNTHHPLEGTSVDEPTSTTAQGPVPKDAIPRFHDLLETCTGLIQEHGPYTLKKGLFERAATPSTTPLTAKQIARSLACAQDGLPFPQDPGPARDDLHTFLLLWATILQILNSILSEHLGKLPLSAFGWGVYGLCSGYVPTSPATLLLAAFNSHKARLYQALHELPSLEEEHVRRARDATPLRPAEKVNGIAKVMRDVHVNAWMLVQIMNGGGAWEDVRWFHGVSVVERWVGVLELA